MNVTKKLKEILFMLLVEKPSFINNFHVSRNTHVYVSKSASVHVGNYSRFNYPVKHDWKTDRGTFVVENKAKVSIGSLTAQNGSYFYVGKGASLTIGENVFFNRNAYIWCRNSITIGSGTYDCSRCNHS